MIKYTQSKQEKKKLSPVSHMSLFSKEKLICIIMIVVLLLIIESVYVDIFLLLLILCRVHICAFQQCGYDLITSGAF